MKLNSVLQSRLSDELADRLRSGNLPRRMLEVLSSAAEEPSFHVASVADRALKAEVFSDVRVRSVVRAFDRPSVLVQDGTFASPVSEIWGELLSQQKSVLENALPGVGRIESGSQWFGTGVLVAPGVVATNRHVARKFLVSDGAGWTFAPAQGGGVMSPRIDFREEFDRLPVEEFDLIDVLLVEGDQGSDLALLKVSTAGLAAEPVVLGTAFEADDAVAVVGYTSKEPGMSPEVEEILTEIFGTIFNVKRLAPGRLLSISGEELTHDASTQGGNSGSAILDLETGNLVGLHFAGGLEENFGLTASVLDRRLQEVG